MEAVTVSLGKKLRKFSQITCSAFATKELPREYSARIRRCAKKAGTTAYKTSSSNNPNTASSKAAAAYGSTPTPVETNKSPARAGRQSKALNLSTYKGHSLGDYVHAIRRYGTTDSYSTEPVRDLCLSFDIIKRMTFRVNWNIDYRNQDTLAQAVKASSSR
jgi:hypothetical protein